MIQLTTENKYRFDMQVSARAIGSQAHPLRPMDTIGFHEIDQGANRRKNGSSPNAFAAIPSAHSSVSRQTPV
jgi:hypothetical protein